jgi:agmatine deiminase
MMTRRQLLKLSLASLAVLATNRLDAKNSNMTTPKADGFYFPAEWRPHDYTIMQFVPAQNWRGYGLKAARRDWARVANTLNEYEPVLMVVDPKDSRIAKKLLSADIELVEYPLNDGWSRDSAPMFVVNDAGERRASNFIFNGWGEKFPPYSDDAKLKARLCRYLNISAYQAPLVSEGGAITTDGEGTLITTKECLLNPNRNPEKSKKAVERILKAYVGVDKVIWLNRGLTPDPITDGHVDGICVFVAPATVMLHTTNDRSDPNYRICQNAKKRLLSETDAQGRPLDIIELPLAWDVAHINFYIANNVVVVPIAGKKRQDEEAMSIIRNAFPERKVVGVSGKILAKGGGGVHCITQQVPQIYN